MFACASLASSARLADQACVFVLSSTKRIFSPPTRNISAMAKSSEPNDACLVLYLHFQHGCTQVTPQCKVCAEPQGGCGLWLTSLLFADSIALAIRPYAAGGMAACFAQLSVQPAGTPHCAASSVLLAARLACFYFADTMKTRIQISGRSFVDLAKATYAEAGVAGFYHGCVAVCSRQVL